MKLNDFPTAAAKLSIRPVPPSGRHHDHQLCRFGDLIDRAVFDEQFGVLYSSDCGSPGKPTQPMVWLRIKTVER